MANERKLWFKGYKGFIKLFKKPTIEEKTKIVDSNMHIIYYMPEITDKTNLSDYDPFLENYSYADKKFKQEAWKEVEKDFNCKRFLRKRKNR